MLQALQKLRSDWEAGIWEKKDGDWFPTPGLTVLEPDAPEEGETGTVTVRSRNAEQIRGMVRAVRNALLDDLDYYDQEELYRRMGEAANRAAADSGDGNCREILESVLAAAEDVYDDWNRYLVFLFGEEMDETFLREICPTAKRYGTGTADGFRITLDAAGHLTALPDSEESVEGILYMLTQQEMIALDMHENGTEDRFRKRTLVVESGGDLLSAQTFLSVLPEGDRPVPDAGYEKACRAAERAGMSEAYLKKMRSLGR